MGKLSHPSLEGLKKINTIFYQTSMANNDGLDTLNWRNEK